MLAMSTGGRASRFKARRFEGQALTQRRKAGSILAVCPLHRPQVVSLPEPMIWSPSLPHVPTLMGPSAEVRGDP